MHTDLAQRLGFTQPRLIGVDQNQRHVCRALAAVTGLGDHDHHIAVGTVGDIRLRAIDYILVTVQPRRRNR